MQRTAFHQVMGTNLFIGNWISSTEYNKFSLIFNCTQEDPQHVPVEFAQVILSHTDSIPDNIAPLDTDKTYVKCNIPEGKKGRKELLASFRTIDRIYGQCVRGPTLIHCRQGIDRSMGVLLLLLAKYHPELFQIVYPDTGYYQASEIKHLLEVILIRVQSEYPYGRPTRTTMKQLYAYFQDEPIS